MKLVTLISKMKLLKLFFSDKDWYFNGDLGPRISDPELIAGSGDPGSKAGSGDPGSN